MEVITGRRLHATVAAQSKVLEYWFVPFSAMNEIFHRVGEDGMSTTIMSYRLEENLCKLAAQDAILMLPHLREQFGSFSRDGIKKIVSRGHLIKGTPIMPGEAAKVRRLSEAYLASVGASHHARENTLREAVGECSKGGAEPEKRHGRGSLKSTKNLNDAIESNKMNVVASKLANLKTQSAPPEQLSRADKPNQAGDWCWRLTRVGSSVTAGRVLMPLLARVESLVFGCNPKAFDGDQKHILRLWRTSGISNKGQPRQSKEQSYVYGRRSCGRGGNGCHCG